MALVMDVGALVLLVVLHPLRVSERPAVSDAAIKGNAFPGVVVNFISVSLSVVPRLQV
jgi:hypothetical protein